MYGLALPSFRASISVMGDLSVLKKKNCKCVNIYYRASPLQKTLILLALKLIMAQSTDPPDIEQSQKYRVKKNYFFCVKMANVVFPINSFHQLVV